MKTIQGYFILHVADCFYGYFLYLMGTVRDRTHKEAGIHDKKKAGGAIASLFHIHLIFGPVYPAENKLNQIRIICIEEIPDNCRTMSNYCPIR